MAQPSHSGGALDRQEAGIESHSPVRHLALRVAGWLLTLTLLVAMFWQGGVEPAAMAALFVLGALTWPLIWSARPHRRPDSTFAWLWVALGTYTSLLLVPLPRGLVAGVHPRAVAISDAGRAALGLGPASSLPLALAPGEAAFQGALYLLAGAFGLMLAAHFTRPGSRVDVRQIARFLVWPIAVSAVLWVVGWQPAVAGLLPHEVARMVRSLVFVNANHQAAVEVVGLTLALGAAMDARNERVSTIYGAVSAVLGLAVLLTTSRGGILAAFFALALTGYSMPQPHPHMRREERDRRASKRQRNLLAVLSVVIVMVVATLPLLEPELEFLGEDNILEHTKLHMMGRTFGFLGDGWLFGQGPGALPVAVATAIPDMPSRLDFAENIVADRLLSGGLWGGLTFLLALAWLTGSLVRTKRRYPGYTPLWIAMCALLVHELVDFSMEVAGGLLLFMVVATLAERLRPRRKHRASSDRPGGSKRRLVPGQVGAAFSLGLGALLLLQSQGNLSRQVDQSLAELSAQQTADRIADGLLHQHQAWYLLGRRRLDEGRLAEAGKALDRAMALRPASAHARLFRFAVRVKNGDVDAALQDLVVLLGAPKETFEQTMAICVDSGQGSELLQRVIPMAPERSYDIGRYLFARRPDLLEQVALALRRADPDRRFAIEGLRAQLYIRRGLFEPVRRISAALMANPDTELAGWSLEASVLVRTGRPYEAFHLFKEVCDHWPHDETACLGAINAILLAERPKQALAYIRGRFPQMRSTPFWAAQYWRALSRAYLQLNRADDALMAAERVLGYARGDREARELLVRAKIMLGDRQGARQQLDSLRVESPTDPAMVELSRAVSATARGLQIRP